MFFEVLISDDASRPHTLNSIRDHLARLFNARQGSINHMPDYGLPCLYTIYQSFPEGKHSFLTLIKKTIERFEPRLTNVMVIEQSDNQGKCVIHINISADILSIGPAVFESKFLSSGKVNLHEPN